MDEIWKDIEGYEGLYQVSNLGRVRSLDRYVRMCCNAKRLTKGQILKLKINKFGYLDAGLHKEGKQTMYRVNRLVAQAFIPNPDNLPQVNHINEIKTDNRAVNLEWMSAKDNTNYGTGVQRRADKQSKQVYQYTLDNQLVKVWASSSECGRNGFCQGHVASCCRGERRKHKGYKWSYQPL